MCYCHGIKTSEPSERMLQFLRIQEQNCARCDGELDYGQANRVIEKLLNILGYDKKFYSE